MNFLPPVQSLVYGRILILTLTNTLTVAALTLSMTVNAVMTGLIVFRIFKVFQEVKTGAEDRMLGVADGSTPLRRVIFAIIESGTALFFFQLIRLILAFQTVLHPKPAINAYYIFASIHTMLNVIITVNDFYLTDNMSLFRVSHLHSFWCGCRWDCLSTTRIPL